jgi:ribosomal protein S18 acetylase RimI-like enzyme
MDLSIRRLDAAQRDAFCAVLRSGSDESGPCMCTAYHQQGYDAPGAGQACRDGMFDRGVSDGYLLYRDGRAVGWCQCAPWTSFAILGPKVPQHPDAWVMTCLVLARDAQGQGLAHRLVALVLDDLRRRGVPYVLACGHRLGPTYSSPLAELPESVCVKAGMTLVKDHPECPMYGMRLD